MKKIIDKAFKLHLQEQQTSTSKAIQGQTHLAGRHYQKCFSATLLGALRHFTQLRYDWEIWCPGSCLLNELSQDWWVCLDINSKIVPVVPKSFNVCQTCFWSGGLRYSCTFSHQFFLTVDFDQGQTKGDIGKSGHLKLQRWKKHNYWER